ncbi:hypothetical protein PSTG_16909 [Puccinia striiformis f. sp. tritici PST-78]|uniref:HAT C-terminal dimerisation domain-containing protein n=2 Tax=Puccinia striiformis f. sp. tritici PST-78 TaxID=1165861 RepID=A0A0L0URD9_9BASI|nr:hypothetical protein PSTG_16909 [Puccinia striiformis f. sp. tritici PST-78]
MIAFPCKSCGKHINWPAYENSTTNLAKHVAGCLKKQQDDLTSQKLVALGVSGTGDIDPREVPQLCAIWCAEGARPFSALGEDAHRGILHPVVLKVLPTRKAVLRDIGMLYTAVQKSFIDTLKKHQGAMYLGLDTWQSPNGLDVLGTVIYRLVQGGDDGFRLEAVPLDFVRLKERYTGVYLAEIVRTIVEKFGVQNRICGIVTDNATNNQAMVDEMKKFKWPRFKGEAQWVRCFAHILNLIVQVILRPFGSHKKKTGTSSNVNARDSDEEDSDGHDLEDQIEILNREPGESEDEDDGNDSPPKGGLASELIDENEVELEIDDVVELSDEEDDDRYSSRSCKETLAKFGVIARKLNKSPNSKALFVDICKDKNCLKPHNVERDLRTQWNSTLMQLSSILRCSKSILEWQKDKRHGTLRAYHINHADLDLAQDLADILQIFLEITLQVHLSTAISDQRDIYSPALRNACRAVLQLTNKYYTLTDCSPLYRVAMVLHPSFKDEYFKLAKWQPEWIVESIRITREMWELHYKPSPQSAPSKPSNPRAKPQTGVLAGLSGASEARQGTTSTDPLNVWLAGGLTLDDEGQPVNPLKWWIKQGCAGNTHGGLLQMALDVLSCPATTVDVERLFNFGQDYVSVKRHRLSPLSIARGMTVSFYSKNGMIPSGVLREWKVEKQAQQKQNVRGKGKPIVIEL